MSKIVRITPEYIEQCKEQFAQVLQNAKLADGKINFTKTFSTDSQQKTVLYFSPEAWVKMFMLLSQFDKEVAWHGVAERLGDNYMITDIVVYPQTVTGTTVDMDTEKYAQWLMDNAEDERFYNIHMQGHSHVRMQPNPSAVDLAHQEEILAQLDDDNFYIFMIYNKELKRNIKIYDMRKNILYEDADIETLIDTGTVSFEQFMKESKEMVVERSYAGKSGTNYGGYNYGGYNGYNQNYKGNTNPTPLPATKTGTGTTGTTTGSTTGKPYDPIAEAKKTDTKPVEKPKTQIGAGWHGADKTPVGQNLSMYDDDDDYSGYGIYH